MLPSVIYVAFGIVAFGYVSTRMTIAPRVLDLSELCGASIAAWDDLESPEFCEERVSGEP